MKKKLKIGIIGAGPSGSMAGLLLARLGHHITILEKRSSISRKVCGEYLCPQGVELLETYQLKDTICQDFLPLNGMILTSPQGISVECNFPSEQKVWFGISLNRQIFDSRLLNEALNMGAEIKYNELVKNLSKQGDQWTVVTESHNHYKFDLIIAADGRVSTVAKILNHSSKLVTNKIAIHFFMPRKKYLNLRLGEMHIFKDGSYCGLDPINDDEVNISFVFDTKKIAHKNLNQLCNHYISKSKRLFEMFQTIPQNVEIKTTTPLKNKNTFIAGNGIAYIGDSAGFIDPLTGEGIYNALLSAHLLVKAIEVEENLEKALTLYKKNKNQVQFQKKVLNTIFQSVIKSPIICWSIAKYLNKKRERADIFIGIIGNIYSPVNGFFKMLWT